MISTLFSLCVVVSVVAMVMPLKKLNHDHSNNKKTSTRVAYEVLSWTFEFQLITNRKQRICCGYLCTAPTVGTAHFTFGFSHKNQCDIYVY